MADAVIGRGYLQVVPKMDKGALETELTKAGKSGSSSFTKSFNSGVTARAVAIGNVLSSAFLKGVDKASEIAGKVFADSFANYMEFEQLAGGVEKIFDQMDNSRIFADAQEAWRDLNMSANDYLSTINQVGATFSASMGDEKGYEAARMGMKAIADYASGTGLDLNLLNEKFKLITRSTSSYQSVCDQFSGILPQTNKEFLEQAQAAGFLSKEYKSLTEVPVAEYQEAVVKMLQKGTKELGLYGNTAAETAHTISGSINGAKAGWSIFLTGIADEQADMDKLTKDLVESIGYVVDNAMPRVMTIFDRLGPALSNAISGVIHNISPEWGDLFDRLAEGAGRLAEGFANIAEQAMASGILEDIANAIYDIGDALSSADFTGFFEVLGDALEKISELRKFMQDWQAEAVMENGGMYMELTDPSTWHVFSEESKTFQRDLEAMGASIYDYGKLSDSTMKTVADSYRDNGHDMEAALASAGLAVDEYSGKIVSANEVKLRDQYAKVELEDDQLVDAQGNLYTWNGTKLLDKDGNVVMDQVELVNAQGNVKVWNGTRLVDKNASVKVDTSSIDEAKYKWNVWTPATKFVDLVVKKVGGDAAGGFFDLHAGGGFITDGTTYLGSDANGVHHVAGESGREWVMRHADGTTSIVPIENRKYLEPYASTIASMIGNDSVAAEIRDLKRDLGKIIAASAPTATPRELHRINQKVAAYA